MDQTHSNQANPTADQSGSQDERSHANNPNQRPSPVAFDHNLSPLTPPEDWLPKLQEFGVSLESNEINLLGKYLAALMDVNTRTNLTAIRDEAMAWDRHIFDALTLVAVLGDLPEGANIIDVGSGGGLPGIPLAIALPHLNFTLLDATKKKTDFIASAAKWLNLPNVSTLNARAEPVGQDKAHRAHYDASIARAVGKIAMIAELTVPLTKVGGLIVLTKGEQADTELSQAKKALHMLHTSHAGTVDTPTGRIVVLEKRRETPKMYPRRDGEPKRAPLGVTNA